MAAWVAFRRIKELMRRSGRRLPQPANVPKITRERWGEFRVPKRLEEKPEEPVTDLVSLFYGYDGDDQEKASS